MAGIFHTLYVNLLCGLGKAVDIRTDANNPAHELSNLAPYSFTFRGITFHSMESLLQGLKFKGIAKQNQVFKLDGRKAILAGERVKSFRNQQFYWQGKPMTRDSIEYGQFLYEAYQALAENKLFRKAIMATGNKHLYSTSYFNESTNTLLKEDEFCSILTQIRHELQELELKRLDGCAKLLSQTDYKALAAKLVAEDCWSDDINYVGLGLANGHYHSISIAVWNHEKAGLDIFSISTEDFVYVANRVAELIDDERKCNDNYQIRLLNNYLIKKLKKS